MDKTKTKTKGLIKATAVGFAFMLATAFFPVNAIAHAEDYVGVDKVNENTTRIEVDGENQSINVKKGQVVTIPEGVYVYNNGTEHVIGTTPAAGSGITSSTVEVYYKSTNDKLSAADTLGGQFIAARVGRYTIVYTVVANDVTYSYELNVNCEASEANFDFETNTSNIVPNVYDIAMADAKDIILPLPTVTDADGEEVLTAEDEEYYVIDKDTSSIATNEKNAYVSVSISNAGKAVNIKSRTNAAGKKELYIAGADLAKAELNGQEFKVYYSYYQVGSGDDIFVSSVSKSFTVRSNYYYTNSKKEDAGYSLTTDWSTSVSSLNAVVGVEKELPKITATTKSTNSPASESVEVYYTIKVMKGDVDVTADVMTEDGKFKAKEEGDYRFIYSVSDFYGNTVKESSTTFTIENVKDTVSANVYMYDAGNVNAYDAENNKYQSADKLLKSQTVNRNIIMYAVGGTDNMVAKENLTLRREILDNSSVKMFVIDEQAYNAYNLIFAPAVASGETTLDGIYKQIVVDNFEIYKQMLMEGKDVTSASEIKAWLKNNKYLLVATEENKFNGAAIVTVEEGEKATAEDYIEAGFAYVKPKNANNKTFKDQTYSFYYYANDKINSEKSLYYTLKVSEGFTDEAIPTLTFASDLQMTYLPNESFDFSVATADDAVDTRINAVTAYRYLDADKKAIASVQTNSTLKYVVANAKESLSKEWYAQKGVVESTGWYVDENKSTYSVDLANRPQGANYVEILAYAIDDYGNAGFYHKEIEIADADDNDMPTLYQVENAPEVGKTYEAPAKITLPTLHFADSNVNYMHASVAVYKLTENGKVRVQSSNMNTDFDTYMDTFMVKAGSFNASTAGKYQVAITVKDSGNHSVTTYFNYEVKGGAVVEVPEINNISADTIELEAGQTHYLVPPTISLTETDEYGYVGISNDDSNVATNYSVSAVSATGEYDLDQYYFKGNEKGFYNLQYNVYLMQYDKSFLPATGSAAVDGNIFFEGDNLKFKYDGKEYYVYIDRNTDALTAKTQKTIGEAISDAGLDALKEIVTPYALKSKVQSINVGGVEMKVTFDDNVYSESYSTLGESVKIVKPTNISYNGSSYETNNNDSKVTITKTTGNTTTTLAEFSFEEWGDAIDTGSIRDDLEVKANGDVYLKLNDNGKYTIKYSIQAQDKSGLNVGSAKPIEYTISNGDVNSPELELKSNLVKEKYCINDTMTLNLAGISVSDNITTDKDKLLKTMVVTLENTDLNEGAVTLENQETEEGKYAYSHKLVSAGSYTLSISVTDEAGNKKTEKIHFEVTTEEKKEVDVKEVMGGVLIGLSVAVLAGVVIYFVVSKVKLDKKEKRYKGGNDKK